MFGKSHKPKVLIIEDDRLNGDLFRDAFSLAGFFAVTRENADGNFVDDVIALKPDIISMDLMMGKDGTSAERDGFQAIETLKHDPRTAKIPIIILTHFTEPEKVIRSKELGAVDFLSAHSISVEKIPDYFLKYLKNPKRYKPSHSLFRSI